MSLFVAIEGGDGAGKATAARNLSALLESDGISATVVSFPRYRSTVGGVFLGEFLSGRLEVPVTPKAAAILYAMDRLESVSVIDEAALLNQVVIFDRYIASNVAYQAAKVAPEESASLIDWIIRLEVDMFGLRAPDLSIYLDTPIEQARDLMLLKEKRDYTEREYDEHEADVELQRRVRLNYTALTRTDLLGSWVTVNTVEQSYLRDPQNIAAEIRNNVVSYLRSYSPTKREDINSTA